MGHSGPGVGTVTELVLFNIFHFQFQSHVQESLTDSESLGIFGPRPQVYISNGYLRSSLIFGSLC